MPPAPSQTVKIPSTAVQPEKAVVEARYQASGNLAALLDQLGVSVVVSTYQAGKLLVLGTDQGELSVSFNNFDRAMGVAIRPGRIAVGTREGRTSPDEQRIPVAIRPGQIAVGTRSQLWFLNDSSELAPRLEPHGKHDACYLTRSSHVTGEIQSHELSFAGNDLWIVNTLFSCLCTLSPEYSFVPRWQPPFVTELAAEDRCHLNGLACEEGSPRYVTALSETDTPAGWRPTKATSGCVIDVASDVVITRGLCMPHSPRLHGGELYLLDSGHGRLSRVDRETGAVTTVAELPGFTRGLSFYGPFAFVGLSRIRETSVFGGIPLADERDRLQCGLAVVDLRSGELAGSFTFASAVTEIFAVEVLPTARCPYVVGPERGTDEGPPIWYAPRPVPIAE